MVAPPPYETFREFSCFIPELADFGMSWTNFQQMGSACGVLALGGYGVGDLCIMFKQHCDEMQLLTYQGFSDLARVVASRTSEVTWEIQQICEPEGSTLLKHRPKSAKPVCSNKTLGAPLSGRNECLGGAAGLAVKLRPPCLAREVIPVPQCKHARIASKIEGIQVMIKSGELYLVKAYIPQLKKDWLEAIVEEAQLKGDEEASTTNKFLPEDGEAWLSLTSAQISLGEGRFRDARSYLKIASQFHSRAGFDEAHDYVHACALCNGIASYFLSEYEQALQEFVSAKELAAEAIGINPSGRRHEASALNNMAVCMQMTGRHIDAIRSYRKALLSISHPLMENSDACDPLRNILYRNLNRALRFQVGSPGVINPCTEAEVKHAVNQQSMACFLQKMVVGRPKSAPSLLAPPPKTVQQEKKSKKSAGKAQKKGKKKPKKKSSTGKIAKFPLFPPHYGVENVKLPTPKKGKKKK